VLPPEIVKLLDALLINPGGRQEIYQELGDDLAAIEQPLWCRLIAGYLVDKGFHVQILDADAEGLSYEEVATHIAKCNPRYVGMVVHGQQPSASTQQMGAASKTCTAITKIPELEDTPIIMMGGHVSALPERTLKEEDVDFVAVGEGAITLHELLKLEHIGMIGSSPKIPGLGYLDMFGKAHINPPPPNLDLDQLHGNVWSMLPMEKYRSHNWQSDKRQPYAAIYTSLQCPFSCNFCMINAQFGGPGYRTRKPEDVVAEIKMLHDAYGVKTFKIIDEMFVLKPSHYLPICEGLAGMDINIWAYARIDTVKPKTLKILRKAGIQWLALGIESADEVVRDGAEKSLNQQDISDIVMCIRDNDIKVIGNFIFGLENDNMMSMLDTYELACNLECDFVNFYSAMPYPGSQLFNKANPEDLPDSWSGYSQHSKDCKPLRNKCLSATEILAFRDAAHCQYFKGDPELSKPLKRDLLCEKKN
jgi:radical SAM superfamily enzyme YgiQ (UPF0313 family)